MRVTVKLFGALREEVGESELAVELDEGATAADLRRQLAAKYAGLERLGERLATSVNFELVSAERALSEGDEVVEAQVSAPARGHPRPSGFVGAKPPPANTACARSRVCGGKFLAMASKAS